MTGPHALENGPLIPGARVVLRPTTAADLSFLHDLWNDGEVMRYVGFPQGLGITQDQLAGWWERCHRWSATHLVVETPDGVQVGESGWGFDGRAGTLELKVARSHQGQGYGRDALETLLEYLWGHTTLDEAIITPHRENVAARRLYRQLGFRPALPHPGWQAEGYDYWTLRRPAGLPQEQPDSLLFDWGGVLMRTEDDSGRRRWEARLGMPPGSIDQAVFGSSAWGKAQLGQLTAEVCWQQIGESLRLEPTALADFRHDFFGGDRLDQELLQRLRQWKADGYRLALVSNYSTELDALLDQYGVRPSFDQVVISAHEGLTKPAAWFYWRTINRLGVSPARSVLVDDSAENIAGARQVGLHAIHFGGTEQTIGKLERLLS